MARAQRVSTEHKPPKNAESRIRGWASEGSTKKGIAYSMGVSIETLNIWLERFPKLQAAYDTGRDMEHKVLFNALFEKAKAGNVTAAIFLLKARHGYREGDQSEMGNKVSINFELPGAMSVKQFTSAHKVIEHDDKPDDN